MDIFKRFEEVKNLRRGFSIPTIGVLQEKTLHKVVKNLYVEDVNKQEVKIGPFYADILDGKTIIEVQTKQFNHLREKLDYYLSLDKYKINIIYPIFNSKMIYNVSDLGEITGPKKSPKKLKYPEVFYELYKIKQYLDKPNIKVTLLVFDIDEYRENGKSRSGKVCRDRIPTKLIEEIILDSKLKYQTLLPEGLNEVFTSSDIASLTKTKLRYVNNMLNVMKYLGVVEQVGKDKQKYLYKVCR